MLKTCLNTFGNVFRHFEKLKVFPVFWSFSKCRPYRVHWALFSEKIAWKQVQNLCGDFQDYFWTLLRLQFFFDFFFQVLQISISRLHWARKIRKNYLKQVWTLLITFFGILNFWSLFDSCGFFWVSRVHWAELFSVEIIKQNMPKQCFWERFWRNLKVSQFFHFFVFFCEFRPPRVHWAKIFAKKNTSKHVENMFDCFWELFFRHFESFSSFLKFFQVSTLQGKLVIFFNQKNYLGACWKLVWTLLGKILLILKKKVFQFFLSFSKFRPSRVHWALFFREKPQNKFKTCLDTFGNVFGYLEFWEVFAFLWNFSTSRPSRVHWPKNFDKITSNLVWTLLVTFLDTFEISKCFRLFFELFQVSTLQGKLVIFLPKKLPRSMLKTCLNTFGKDFGHFEKKSFSIFLKFFQVSTLQGALGTFFSRKTSKQVQNLFGYFWKRVWVSWILGSFCISLKFFDFSTLQGALTKKFR